MSRIEVLGVGAGGAQTTQTVTGLTLSGTNRLVEIAVTNWNDSATVRHVDTITIGGTTVYDLGVSEGARVFQAGSDAQAAFLLEVFRVFDAALPANGERDVVVTLDGANDAGLCVIAVSYDAADQTTGHRGSPVTYTAEDTSVSMAITADAADQEGIAFLAWDNSGNTMTPTAPTTTLAGPFGTGVILTCLARPAGGTPIAGTFSGDNARDVGWAASILATGGSDRDVVIRYGSMLLTGGSGLIMAAFASGAAVVAMGGGAYFQRRRKLDDLTHMDDF